MRRQLAATISAAVVLSMVPAMASPAVPRSIQNRLADLGNCAPYMASRTEVSLRPSWGSVLIASLAVAFIVLASVIARSTFGPSATAQVRTDLAQPSSNPAQASTDLALPMPDADIVSRVLDETSVAPTISADQAIALARANPSHLVGESPMVQLVSTTTTRPGSPLDGFTGWVILSTDVPGYLYGPITAPSVTIFSTYSWVFVALNGDVLVATQNSYLTPESVPALP